MTREMYDILAIIAIILTITFAVKMYRTKVMSDAAELAASPIFFIGAMVKYFAYFGGVVAGITGVFSVGMLVFIYLGGSVVMPESISFSEVAVPTRSTNVRWEKVPADIARWRDHIAVAAKECNVDEIVLVSLVQQESGGNPNICSHAGACGLTQLMPQTAIEMGVHDLGNPLSNLKGGACYLGKQLKRYDGDVDLALAAYNTGAGSVDRYGGIPPFKETQLYIRNINVLMDRYTGVPDLQVVATPLPYEIAGQCCRWPTDKGVISQWSRSGHVALDIAIVVDTPIYASHDGTVTVSSIHNGKNGGYGDYMMVEGTTFKTLYGHLSVRALSVGERVTAGDLLGYSGNTGNSTGPHLHFEIYENGTLVDPTLYLPARKAGE